MDEMSTEARFDRSLTAIASAARVAARIGVAEIDIVATARAAARDEVDDITEEEAIRDPRVVPLRPRRES